MIVVVVEYVLDNSRSGKMFVTSKNVMTLNNGEFYIWDLDPGEIDQKRRRYCLG